MVRGTKAKTTALVLTAVCIAAYVTTSILDGSPIGTVAVSKGCSLLARLTYHFFHASLVHLLINCWCLLSVVFIYSVPLWYLVAAFIIAATIPDMILSAVPTIGLSAVCFSLLGMVSFQSQRKWLFHIWVLSFLLCSFLMALLVSLFGYVIASPNTILHIYSYVVGLMVGYLNSPVHEKK